MHIIKYKQQKTDKSIQYIVVAKATCWTIYSQDYLLKVVQKKFKKVCIKINVSAYNKVKGNKEGTKKN